MPTINTELIPDLYQMPNYYWIMLYVTVFLFVTINADVIRQYKILCTLNPCTAKTRRYNTPFNVSFSGYCIDTFAPQ